MKVFAPEYYGEFRCIAHECIHNCCIGWEIDIDEDTLGFYRNMKGAFGKRLKGNISEGEDAHFLLGDGERCPFLNESNLCDIHKELGEDKLCDICKDHPRFRNFFSGRTEIGLGLCCEAVVELILERTTDFELLELCEDEAEGWDDEYEDVFFALRDKAFDIVQNEELSFEECVLKLEETFDIAVPKRSFESWIDFFLSLEILDEEWKTLLQNAKGKKLLNNGIFESEKGQRMQRRLLVYFLYRHMGDSVFDGRLSERIGFGLLGCVMIRCLCASEQEPSFRRFKEIARMYSAEIEYSEENTEAVLKMMNVKKGEG